MRIAAIVVGIDGWERYTVPLVESIKAHEANCQWVILDNASTPQYPRYPGLLRSNKRLCYSAAINAGYSLLNDGDGFDWTIVLSNDVLCTGPFAHLLEQVTNGDLVGPCLKSVHGFDYLEGWCVCVPRQAWADWDERFLGSDYEDVAYSTSARLRGYGLQHMPDLPFVHLDQRQRFYVVPDFAGKNAHNRELFLREYARVTA